MKYQDEISFLNSQNELDSTLRLSIEDVNIIVKKYPNLPEEYIDFLKEIGGGYFSNAQYEIKNFIFDISDLGLEDIYDVSNHYVFFGDNHSGDFVGFDSRNKESNVIELDHTNGEIFDTNLSFREFLKSQIGLNLK